MFEKEEGKPNTELTRKIGEYLYSRDIAVKGHPLCWHTVCADWLLKYDNPTIFSKQIERIHRDVSDLKDYFKYWDVINEVVIMPRFDKYDNAITRICKEYGQVELVKKVFQAAKETDPFATLLINDFNTSKAYEDLIERCLDAGIEISAIGIQSHQHQGYWGKEKILDVLERFSRFGLPIHFTENTIVSGTLVPKEIEDLNDWQVESWPSLPEYEALQAEQLEEMYTILFSYPFVKAITQWDFTDGAWLKAPSGLIRQDNTVKPAYTMLKNKIKKQWFTERFETTTNDSGCALVEGFKGKYDLYVDEQRYDFVLDDKGEDLVLHIL
ncbi:MAG: endo-1,4-beta-xylanase [Clostridiales bacterium]|nr:endo-1,4-beta-xylanase [Clostridiales bacterium]